MTIIVILKGGTLGTVSFGPHLRQECQHWGELTQIDIKIQNTSHRSTTLQQSYGRFVLTRESVDEPKEGVEYSMMRSHWVWGWGAALRTLTGVMRTQVSGAQHGTRGHWHTRAHISRVRDTWYTCVCHVTRCWLSCLVNSLSSVLCIQANDTVLCTRWWLGGDHFSTDSQHRHRCSPARAQSRPGQSSQSAAWPASRVKRGQWSLEISVNITIWGHTQLMTNNFISGLLIAGDRRMSSLTPTWTALDSTDSTWPWAASGPGDKCLSESEPAQWHVCGLTLGRPQLWPDCLAATHWRVEHVPTKQSRDDNVESFTDDDIEAYDDGYWLGNKGHGEASPGRAGFSVHRNTTDVKSTATGNNVRH